MVIVHAQSVRASTDQYPAPNTIRDGQKFKITAELWQEWRRPGTDLEEGPIKVQMIMDEDGLEALAEALDLYAKVFPWRIGG